MPRKPIEEDSKLKEEYIKIYFLHYHFNYSWWELEKEFSCSQKKIQLALEWVNKNFLKLTAKELLQGGIFAIQRRLKENTRLWSKEAKRRKPIIKAVCELNKEIREDSKHLQTLQQIYRETFGVTGDVSLKASDVLKLIQGKEYKS